MLDRNEYSFSHMLGVKAVHWLMFVCPDIDECSASSPVCDINADCSNTRGSYYCTCKAGFTGDGKACQGK